MCKFYHSIINEIRKELLLVWSYRIQWLCEIISLMLFFFFLSRVNLVGDKQLEFSLMSYATWFYAVLIIGDMGGKLAGEMRTGTFEPICLAIVPILWILIAKTVASIVRSTVLFCLLIIPIVILFSIHISLPNILMFFTVFLGLIPGLLGLSFLLGGITLIVKDASPIVNIVNNTLLFLSGGFIPLDTFPKWIGSITEHLPTTQAIKIFNTAQIGSPFISLLNKATGNLVVHSLVYLIIGLLTFFYCEKKAKLTGTLGHY